MKFFFIIVFLIGFCLISFGETPQQIINPKQTYNKWVSDMADVIGDEDESQINDLIDQLEKKTSAEIAVVTIKSAGDLTPKDFAVKLFNLWGIGKKGKDNGVLVLLVMDARRIEVETGYGTEGILTDGKIGEILDKYVIPKFKEGNFGKGILNGVQAMAEAIESDMTDTFQPSPSNEIVPQKQEKSPFVSFLQTLFGFVIPLTILLVAVFVIRRSFVRYCKKCGKKMRLLSEKEDDAYLSLDQRIEEDLGSINYRVWRCDDCQTCEIKRSVKYMSGYENCPKCNHRTLYVTEHTIREPTYERDGLEEIIRVCRYPKCGYKDAEKHKIPRRQRSNIAPLLIFTASQLSKGSSRSSGFGGWGSSSGGGFSGGSFGGGSSGGGGAGRSW